MDDEGLIPLVQMSVSMFETMLTDQGIPVVWKKDMTLDEKALIAGHFWLPEGSE